MKTTGVVKWFNDSKGYGILSSECTTKDIFVHYSGIIDTGGVKTLVKGQKVQFVFYDGPKGPQASEVEVMV